MSDKCNTGRFDCMTGDGGEEMVVKKRNAYMDSLAVNIGHTVS